MTTNNQPMPVSLLLLDSDPTGRVKCSIPGFWSGVAYSIPADQLTQDIEREDFSRAGNYILTDGRQAYVGQAKKRKNEGGTLGRVIEHIGKIDYFTHAILLMDTARDLSATDVSYIEHRLYHELKTAKRVTLTNLNEPPNGSPSEETQASLNHFIEMAKIAIGSLSHRIFEKEAPKSAHEESQKLYLNRRRIKATGTRVGNGIVVHKNSQFNPNMASYYQSTGQKLHEKHKESLDYQTNTLTEDIPFTTLSGASSFLLGSSSSGWVDWRDSNNKKPQKQPTSN